MQNTNFRLKVLYHELNMTNMTVLTSFPLWGSYTSSSVSSCPFLRKWLSPSSLHLCSGQAFSIILVIKYFSYSLAPVAWIFLDISFNEFGCPWDFLENAFTFTTFCKKSNQFRQGFLETSKQFNEHSKCQNTWDKSSIQVISQLNHANKMVKLIWCRKKTTTTWRKTLLNSFCKTRNFCLKTLCLKPYAASQWNKYICSLYSLTGKIT